MRHVSMAVLLLSSLSACAVNATDADPHSPNHRSRQRRSDFKGEREIAPIAVPPCLIGADAAKTMGLWA
jgi:hypothetical protein